MFSKPRLNPSRWRWCRSEPAFRSAHLAARLPLPVARAALTASTRLLRRPLIEEDVRVLLVEDNAALGRTLAKTLEQRGFHVTLAGSAETARGETGPFDVGVFDITLRDGDGIELARSLLERGTVGGALFCTGSVDDWLVSRARRTGAVVYKDASLTELCEAIRGAAPSAG